MARSDLLVGLVRAATRSDTAGFKRALESIVADERGKQHNVLADRLSEYLTPTNGVQPLPGGSENGIGDVLHARQPRRSLDSLVLPDPVRGVLAQVIEEQHRKDLLRANGLEPRHRLLLVGPPGNGKTSVAEAISEALMLPMFVARYEGIVGSYLGETSNRLKRVFDFARTRACVLFFDEFDTLGKERGDPHDSGEIKRVVSALLLQIDDLPSHVVVVTATNHSELLDRAAWRRFQVRLFLPRPTDIQIMDWIHRSLRNIGASESIAERLLPVMSGSSFSELEDVDLDIRRRALLDQGASRPDDLVGSVLSQWAAQRQDLDRLDA